MTYAFGFKEFRVMMQTSFAVMIYLPFKLNIDEVNS